MSLKAHDPSLHFKTQRGKNRLRESEEKTDDMKGSHFLFSHRPSAWQGQQATERERGETLLSASVHQIMKMSRNQ